MDAGLLPKVDLMPSFDEITVALAQLTTTLNASDAAFSLAMEQFEAMRRNDIVRLERLDDVDRARYDELLAKGMPHIEAMIWTDRARSLESGRPR